MQSIHLLSMELPRPLSIFDADFPSVDSYEPPVETLNALGFVDVNKARSERMRKNRESDVQQLRAAREAKVLDDLKSALRDALEHFGSGTEVTRVVESLLRKEDRRLRRRVGQY